MLRNSTTDWIKIPSGTIRFISKTIQRPGPEVLLDQSRRNGEAEMLHRGGATAATELRRLSGDAGRTVLGLCAMPAAYVCIRLSTWGDSQR